MTVSTDDAPVDPNTAAGMIEFLEAAGEKGWMNPATAKAMKTATMKILEVEGGWENLDLRSLDIEDLFARFVNLRRNLYSDDSMRVYKGRLTKAVQMHLARIDGKDWKALAPAARATSTKGAPRSGAASKKKPTAVPLAVVPDDDGHSHGAYEEEAMAPSSSQGSPVMRFPVPLRDNLDVTLMLPRDLTREEAARLCAVITSLARDVKVDADDPKRAITAG